MTLYIVCMVLGTILILFEKLMPKGVFGTVGIIMFGVGIYMAYRTFETDTANMILAGTLLGLAMMIGLWMRYFPKSRLAKPYVIDETVGEIDKSYREYLDKVGIARTPLRPGGTVEIDGKRVDVIAEGGFIDEGTTVRVIVAEGNRLVVRVEAGCDEEEES